MKNNLKIRLTTSGVLLSVPLLPLIPHSLPAYIDPGTASLAIQILIACFAGGLFLIGAFWRKVKAFFSKLFSKARRGNG